MKQKLCVFCHYARMKRDICGIYCTGGFENPDGTCNFFKDYQEHKKEIAQKRREIKREVR